VLTKQLLYKEISNAFVLKKKVAMSQVIMCTDTGFWISP